MRLRTLPVSVAGVVMASAYAIGMGYFEPAVAWMCLLFAVLAQIASNFANEYYDYRDGLDAPGRVGPRRGVTEGDLTPRAMLAATYITLALACAVGLWLAAGRSWWLVGAGALIALGVIAYSAGPWPFSRHALGEVAVVFYFGIIPVNLTYYLMSGTLFDGWVFTGSVSLGLMTANVLIVNNYRDADADAAVGKTTLAVKFGRRFASWLYLVNGYVAVAMMVWQWNAVRPVLWLLPALWLAAMTATWWRLTTRRGRALNPLLGVTALLALAYALMWLVAVMAV